MGDKAFAKESECLIAAIKADYTDKTPEIFNPRLPCLPAGRQDWRAGV
ncbi:MAG: hypothetical protein J7J51_02170 [Candidatus Omnitrophica bacterium]|nr:hypothetical protein [Candidatus Omnitrophota bacterium]